MKILIVSDTHRKDGNLYDVIEKEKPLDMLIHLGDAEGSEQTGSMKTASLSWCRATTISFPRWTGKLSWI